MRYRRVQVTQNRKGQYDVVSYGCFTRMLYWWLFAIFAIGFCVTVAKYWYVWLPIIAGVILLYGQAKKAKLRKAPGVQRDVPPQGPTCPRV